MSQSLLTARQEFVYGFIVSHLRSHGYPPTLREIGKVTGTKNTRGVECHLKALVKKGWLTAATGERSRTCVPVVAPNCCAACGQRLS